MAQSTGCASSSRRYRASCSCATSLGNRRTRGGKASRPQRLGHDPLLPAPRSQCEWGQVMRIFLKISLVAAALLVAPVVADAADPGRPPPYRAPVVPYYDWSGFYVGAHAGVAWSDSDFGDTGFIGGGQVGFNHQVGQWVFGVEGTFSGTSIKESFNIPGIVNAEVSVDWISTFAFRAGWAFDRWLVYGKFGGAWANVSADVAIPFLGLSG